MKIKSHICKVCGKEYQKYTTTQKYCSPRCVKRAEGTKIAEKKKKSVERKKNSVSYNLKKADKLWSEIIRSIGYCEYCGASDKTLNAHHIIGRRHKATRLLPMNGVCLCANHHTFSDEFSAHQTPVEFTYWLERTKGKDFIESLMETGRNPIDFTADYIKEQTKNLENVKKIGHDKEKE